MVDGIHDDHSRKLRRANDDRSDPGVKNQRTRSVWTPRLGRLLQSALVVWPGLVPWFVPVVPTPTETTAADGVVLADLPGRAVHPVPDGILRQIPNAGAPEPVANDALAMMPNVDLSMVFVLDTLTPGVAGDLGWADPSRGVSGCQSATPDVDSN